MDYDKDKVDELAMALMFLTTSKIGSGGRSWRGFDAATLERLHAKGWISDPNAKGTSLMLSPEGMATAEAAFHKHCRAD
jgi:hypothetical protein